MRNDLITPKQAAKEFDISIRDIHYYVNSKKINNYSGRKRRYIISRIELFNLLSKRERAAEYLTAYGEIDLDFDEVMRPIESIMSPNNILKPAKYATVTLYAVTNKGRVLNLTRGTELTQSNAAHGYKQVGLRLIDGDISERVHILVAMSFCQNRLLKSEVHHIDGNPLNNWAVNLLWLTKEEHRQAHKLLDNAKLTNDYSEYNRFIDDKQDENRWTEEYRSIILHKEIGNYIVWITKQDYRDFKMGKDISDRPYFESRFIPSDNFKRFKAAASSKNNKGVDES